MTLVSLKFATEILIVMLIMTVLMVIVKRNSALTKMTVKRIVTVMIIYVLNMNVTEILIAKSIMQGVSTISVL